MEIVRGEPRIEEGEEGFAFFFVLRRTEEGRSWLVGGRRNELQEGRKVVDGEMKRARGRLAKRYTCSSSNLASLRTRSRASRKGSS